MLDGTFKGLMYDLYAILVNGKRIRLLSGLNDPGEARFLEARMEQSMGIEDHRVVGELHK